MLSGHFSGWSLWWWRITYIKFTYIHWSVKKQCKMLEKNLLSLANELKKLQNSLKSQNVAKCWSANINQSLKYIYIPISSSISIDKPLRSWTACSSCQLGNSSVNDLRLWFSKVSFFWTESFQWFGRTDSQSADHSAVFRNNMGNYRYYS